MPYITHQQLLDRPGSRELAEVASNEDGDMVPYELMALTLSGGDRSAFDVEQIADADAALARIDDAIADADGVIDGYLRIAGYSLLLVPVPRLVVVWSRAITRYYLHKNRRSLESDDIIVRDYKDAQRLLEQTASGKLSLGADDEVIDTGVGMPQVSKGSSRVRDAMKDY
jgi:phage gp36-like protein